MAKDRPEPFDVACVPDFDGKNSHIFEARALFFLASWMERAGAAREFPLHVACIGEPPESVRWLAEQAGASVTVHEPVRILPGRNANKLRGLEIKPGCDQGLLVDVDMLFLGDMVPLASLGRCMAASPENQARIPEEVWARVYAHFGMDPPVERIASIKGELGLKASEREGYEGRTAESRSMLPYYNSGVVWHPWECKLGKLWEEHLRGIASFAKDLEEPYRSWPEFKRSDQTAFAVVVEKLKRSGVSFNRLGDEFHARWMHVGRGAMRLSEMRLFHAIGFMRKLGHGRGAVERGMEAYFGRLRRRSFEGRGRIASIVASRLLFWHPHVRDMKRLIAFIREIYSKHVIKALKETGRDEHL